MSKINKKLIIFFIAIGFICFFVTPALAGDLGLKATSDKAGLTTSDTIPVIVGNLIGAGLTLVGILFFALMLFGGITWMLARGNQEMEKKALNTITGAIIGIIIVASSYAITNFVFKGIEGSSYSSGGSSSDSSKCSGKSGTFAGCDTCATTQKSDDWSCRISVDCSTAEGEKADDDLCNAPGQGDEIKCCKAKASCQAGTKSINDFCLQDCTADNCEAEDSFVNALCSQYCVKEDFCQVKDGINMDEVCVVDEDNCVLVEDKTNLCKWE